MQHANANAAGWLAGWVAFVVAFLRRLLRQPSPSRVCSSCALAADTNPIYVALQRG